ncbi:hypothetical protein [Salinarimonas soli]|uniref:Lipoprotein n=1 Tax=Salinarimonas soli TaxID=1638099 RepID=A0A5B2VD76_9HYPH|nr:hypothetical protein [Salinarimonas soli]KAA2236678.1 hypothetical protein F0L46_13680 [Salinarimonas soli]
MASRTITALAFAAALGLAGCQTAGGALVSAPGVPIAVESIEGAPQGVQSALQGELASAAQERRMTLVGAGADARYRVRGYLSAETTEDGSTAVAFVWDVFDAEKRRAKRVAGAKPIRAASAASPWEGLDRDALRRLAADSMNEIAGFLVADAGPAAAPAGGETRPATALGFAEE